MIPSCVGGLAEWLADFIIISVTDHISYSACASQEECQKSIQCWGQI